MQSDYSNMRLRKSDQRIFRKAKLEYMQYIGLDNLADGKAAAEFSKLISSWIDKQKRASK